MSPFCKSLIRVAFALAITCVFSIEARRIRSDSDSSDYGDYDKDSDIVGFRNAARRRAAAGSGGGSSSSARLSVRKSGNRPGTILFLIFR